MQRMRSASSFLLPLVMLVGCTTTATVTPNPNGTSPTDGGETPGEETATPCSEDTDAMNVVAIEGSSSETPFLAAVLEPSGTAALWREGKTAYLGRFADDGSKPLARHAVGTGASIATFADRYVVAAFGDDGITTRLLDRSGEGAAAKVLSPKTRTIESITGDVTATAPSVRASGDGYRVRWHEDVDTSTGSGGATVLQHFGPDGKATTKQAVLSAIELTSSQFEADSAIVGDRFVALGYRQGARSIVDTIAYLFQAPASGDLSNFTQSKVELPQPTTESDVTRIGPSIFADGDGTIIVDTAYWATSRSKFSRIEIAWLDDLGSVKKTSSIDLDEAVQASAPVAKYDATTKTLVVGWLSWLDTTEPSAHVVSIDAAGRATRADHAIAFPLTGGDIDTLNGIAQDVRIAADGRVELAYAWSSLDKSSVRARHVAKHGFCLANRK